MAPGKDRQTKDSGSNLRVLAGIYHCQVRDHLGKRRTLSLQTSSRAEAEARVAQGLKTLKGRIREQALASAPRHPAGTPVVVWDVNLETGEGTPEEITWMDAAPDPALIEDPSEATWRAITAAARERRMRLKRRDFSRSWYWALEKAITAAKELKLSPQDMSDPTNCLTLIRAIEATGIGPSTLTQRVGCMASALKAARKSGQFPGLIHAFDAVDFRSIEGRQSYVEPTATELETLLQALPTLPRHHRLVIELLLTTGGRIAAITGLEPGDLSDGGVELRRKGKVGKYWVPVPSRLYEDLQQGFEFASDQRIRGVLKEIVPGLVPHALRHLFTSLGRKGFIPLDAQARLLDHSLPKSMTQSVYGTWDHERLREEASKVWNQLNM